jgi:hypothetical protein
MKSKEVAMDELDDREPLQSDEVGHGRPPKHSRFKKGASGNPKGRPKGKRNLATVLQATLKERVVVNENGVRRTVTKLDAAVKQLVNKSAEGDLPALRLLAALASSAEEPALSINTAQDSDADQKVMEGVRMRIESCLKGESNED